MVKRNNYNERFRPVQAVPKTGLFPGFATPLFLPEYVSEHGANTIYAQRVFDEEIISFDPIEAEFTGLFPLPFADKNLTKAGDKAVYVYAFSSSDAAVGSRSDISAVIKKRFDEISVKAFSACTAAQFARLMDRLPEANRKAYKLLFNLSASSAKQWRNTAVFLGALRDEFHRFGIPTHAMNVESNTRERKLEVTLVLELADVSKVEKGKLEKTGRKLLLESGLFGRDDIFTLKTTSGSGKRYVSDLRLFEMDEFSDALGAAKHFLEQKVFQPVLQARRPAKRSINVVRNTRQWIAKFEKIGDLVRYMDRFQPDRQPPLPLMEIKQIQFEDVYAEFMRRFGRYRSFHTTASDFRIGERYSSFCLAIYTQTYNNRGGGIRPVGKVGSHKAVVVSITVSGSKYANEWVEEGVRLKCYLRSAGRESHSHPEEDHNANRSIMKFPKVPILVFTRNKGEKDFLYNGVFRYAKVTADERGRKWFDLVRVNG